ncbi:MAG: GspH/FimT family pseudopilin [bacterium]
MPHASGEPPRGVRYPPPTAAAGFSLLESLLAVALLTLTAAMATPSVLRGLDDARGTSAARHLAGLARLTRAQAALRSVSAGLRFERDGDGYGYAVYVDGNGNGLRRRDVRRGVDPAITPIERIGDRFTGVTIGVVPGVPDLGDDEAMETGSDPVRLGRSDTLTFSPFGTATSGTIFLRSEQGRQYAVRVLGATGRTRIFEFRHAAGAWTPR